jgi:hypothetical protein
MDWLIAHWWQVALVAAAWAAVLEIRGARRDLGEIFAAIWSFPQMKAQSEAARERRGMSLDEDALTRQTGTRAPQHPPLR